MDRIVTDFDEFCTTHRMKPQNVDVAVELDGRYYSLVGKSTGVVDLSVLSVELLRSDSTPQRQFVAGDAPSKFLDAAHSLVKNGTPFYTCLRGNWNLRAYKWEMNK
jgi:hypothetical protein